MANGRLLKTYSLGSRPTDGISVETVGFAAALDAVARVDPIVADAILQELADQRTHLKLIASENFASPAVLLAMGNWLSDKYAEGAPGHRLYAGCDNVDAIESRADELACALFGADHAYAQPHSGIDANLVAFWAVLSQRVEAPALERLAAASRERSRPTRTGRRCVSSSATRRCWACRSTRAVISPTASDPTSPGSCSATAPTASTAETSLLDYDEVRRRAHEERPLMLLAGYSSYPRLVNFRVMREIADEVDATFMVDMAHFAGLVAGKVLTGDYDPVPHAHIVTTTTHKTLRGPRGGLVLCARNSPSSSTAAARWCSGVRCPTSWRPRPWPWPKRPQPSFQDYAAAVVDNARVARRGADRRGCTCGDRRHRQPPRARRRPSFGLNGRQAEAALRAAGITLNRNVVPDETNGPWYTSGLRLGTPAITTLGMGADDMREIADVLADVLHATSPRGRRIRPEPGQAVARAVPP